MQEYARMIDGQLVPFRARFVTIDPGGEGEPYKAPLRRMSEGERIAQGIYEVMVRPAIPTGYQQVGWELVLSDDGTYAIRQPVFEAAEPSVLVAGIKAEANRRITAICPEWKQRNLTAQATMLVRKGEANWTAEDQTAWEAGETIWSKIVAIRVASDVLEQTDPLPTDYTNDSLWPEEEEPA